MRNVTLGAAGVCALQHIGQRPPLEDKQLTAAIFEQVNVHLGERGLLVREGALMEHPFYGIKNLFRQGRRVGDVAAVLRCP